MPLKQQARKGVTLLARAIDMDYREEIRLLLRSEDKEEDSEVLISQAVT